MNCDHFDHIRLGPQPETSEGAAEKAKEIARMVEGTSIVLRRQVVDELSGLRAREVELVARLRQIDDAHEAIRQTEQAVQGRTNVHGKSWRADDTCSWCGSMSVARAIELLKTPGTEYSGADWKYGWPHKFYIASKKFYNEHLRDASPEQLAEFNNLSKELFGVSWDDEGRRYFAVPGIQKYGTVTAKPVPA